MIFLTRLNRTSETWLTLVFGILIGGIGLYLNLSNSSNKIIFVVLGALAAGIVALVVGNVRYLLLGVIFIDQSIGLDLHITCNDQYFLSTCGVNLSMTTLSLVGLYAHWVLTRRTDPTKYPFVRHPRLGLSGRTAAAFIGAGILSLSSARNIGIAFYQLWIFLTLFALFFYLANNIRSREELLYVLSIGLGALFVQNFLMQLGPLGLIDPGISYKISHRVTGTFRSANVAGGYLAQVFTILLACLSLRLPRWQKWIMGIVLLFTFYNLVASESRGGWTSVAIGIIIVLFVSMAKRWVDIKSLILAGLAVVVFAVVFSGNIITRLTADDNGAADARLPLAQIAFNMISHNPVTGVGLNNFGLVLYDYIQPEQFGAWLNLVHNGWLLIWSETGTIGIVCYIAFWLATLWQAAQLIRYGRRTYAVIALGMLASMLGTSMHMMVEIYGNRILLQIIWTEAAIITAMTRFQALEKQASAEVSKPVSIDTRTPALTPTREPL